MQLAFNYISNILRKSAVVRPKAGRAVVTALLVLCAGLSRLSAQEAIPFEHLTVADGLSQGSVNCIFQDTYGFMWFGTQDGLNRFDGYSFNVYNSDPADPATLSDKFIVLIAEDSSRTLWVGSLNAPDVLDRFDRATETFTRVPRDSVDLSTARVSTAFPSYTDPAGVRWSGDGSKGGGLTRFDTRTGKSTVFRHDPADAGSLIADRVYSVVADRAGTIWVGTRAGLDRFNQKTGKFTHFVHDDNDPGSLSDNYVWPMLVDADGHLWVGTFAGGLQRYDPATESFAHFRHDDANPRSLAGDRVLSLYQDASGMIWVGMGDNGVDRFHPDLLNFAHYLHDPTDPRSLSDNSVQTFCVDRTGIVWIGTRSGLNRWDRKTGKFRLYQKSAADPSSIGGEQILTMLEDRSGGIWIGFKSDGLDRLDRATGRFTHYRNNPADPRSLPDNRVYALAEDRRGDLWVGTYGGGLSRLDVATGRFTTYTHDPDNPASLAAPGVWALLEDREGTLWVGTLGGGLDRFNAESGSFTHYRHSDDDSASLSNNLIVALQEDRRGNIWVGTTGGLNRLDRQTGKFRIYQEKDGLSNDVIFGILEDIDGMLWMSTNKGLSRLDPESGEFRNYNYVDGLQGDEFNQFSYAKDPRTGELFFGGANGFNVFDPARIRSNPYVPPVVFSAFNRYNSDDEEGRPVREPGIDTKSRITLSYKDNVANFEFAALNYFNTHKNRYAYWLEGYTDSWIQLGGERRATFTNLDGGDYILHVKGSNNEGVWNEAGAALNITVTPPWWKTRWAYGSYLVLIVAILYGLRREEINRREQKTRIREAQLQAKAAEAEKRALQAENERQLKELEDARRLQLSMLPKEIPEVPGYQIAVFMKTATEVGGDYYDFNHSPEGELNIAFGDATGHGMQAGTIVTLMKGLFISESSKFEIQKFFNHCSRAIKEIKLGRLYMALTLARFNGKNVSLSSAGMPPAYLHRKADGSIEEILLKAVPLGAMKSFPYSLYETSMEEGDTLLLITDGLPEQKNAGEEMFDYARIIDCFRGSIPEEPEEIIRRLVSEGDAWMEGVLQEDDITLMVVRKTAESAVTAAAA
jgi:ligand-binding sensor domain-containing protein/serine phosphatase RsbU (regulator of sigma subunit)